ncbi:MAG: 16S rRNA (cytidine(1402)-2'-O)-methyltransferase [Myxococcales bacterium]|nr:16S rRNA (cytidine(1402)-2'-O)-methyltransferase [Myxococcales bacterium]
MDAPQLEGGVLYLAATPIGNLRDITLRALEALRQADVVAAEDTRHTRELLSAHGIHARLVSYREQNHERASIEILDALERGLKVVLVSDAGTPGISDPGEALVSLAIERGFRVSALPGPSAAIAALCASGLLSRRFLFVGFLPRKEAELTSHLGSLAAEPGTLIFYEAGRRLPATLAAAAKILGPRRAVVARELTKLHEELVRDTLPGLARRFVEPPPGEVVLLVEGASGGPSVPPSRPEIEKLVSALRAGRRLGAAECAALLSRLLPVPRREIYRLAVEIGGADTGDPEKAHE